jgi:cell division transport system permease protein
MKNRRKIAQIIFEALKLITLILLGGGVVFIANDYYQIENYSKELSEELNIFVFFDKNSKNDEKVLDKLNSINSVLVKEYVNASQAYKKTVEKNPILNNISLPNDTNSMQAYAIVKPKSIPNDNFLLEIKTTFSDISDIEEIVFDEPNFLHYAKIQKQLLLYKKAFFIVISIFFIFLILKSVLIYISGANIFKQAKRFFIYLLSSSSGFLLFWSICKYKHYNLLAPKASIVIVLAFACVLVLMLDKIEIE